MRRQWLPLAVFLAIVAFLAIGLRLHPREVPFPLIGKPAPGFSLPRLDDPARTFSPQEMRGQVWLLNVWASWCVSCRQEHPVLLDLARRGVVALVGLGYKDDPRAAQRWLVEQGGDPYRLSVLDRDGRVGIDYGVYGVPETFVIDPAGVIRYKHIGPLSPEIVEEKILPMVEKLRNA